MMSFIQMEGFSLFTLIPIPEKEGGGGYGGSRGWGKIYNKANLL